MFLEEQYLCQICEMVIILQRDASHCQISSADNYLSEPVFHAQMPIEHGFSIFLLSVHH
jgi:hypothetical protein